METKKECYQCGRDPMPENDLTPRLKDFMMYCERGQICQHCVQERIDEHERFLGME